VEGAQGVQARLVLGVEPLPVVLHLLEGLWGHEAICVTQDPAAELFSSGQVDVGDDVLGCVPGDVGGLDVLEQEALLG
jgi:hypothetical protein